MLYLGIRGLEATLISYKDMYYSQPRPVRPPIIVADVFKADAGGFVPSDPPPTWQNSEKGSVDFGHIDTVGNGGDDNVSEYVTDPGSLGSLIQEPISQISRFNGSEVSVTDKTKPKPINEPAFVSDPGGLETLTQESISKISENDDSVDHGNNGGDAAVGENTHPFVDNDTSVKMVDNGGAVSLLKTCDLYMGTWVKDEEYPIYIPDSCPYVDEAFSCQGNGRPDSKYLKWRWKPDGCELPRYENAGLPWFLHYMQFLGIFCDDA